MTFEDETAAEQVIDPFEADVSEPQAASPDAEDDDVVDAHVWRAQS